MARSQVKELPRQVGSSHTTEQGKAEQMQAEAPEQRGKTTATE